MIRKFLLLLFLQGSVHAMMAETGPPAHTFFFQTEWMVGKNVRIYDKFPHSTFRKTLSLDIGYIHRDTTRQWVSYYNYPTLGISAVLSDLGNPQVFNKEYSLIPYVLLKTSRNPKKSLDFKIGLGMTYCTKPYNAEYNPDNLVIGTSLNWGLQLLMYKNLLVSPHLILKSGIGFIHTSDAHTALPNYGLNSAMVSIAMQFPQGNYDPYYAMKQKKLPVDRTKHYFIQIRNGLGWHELGGTVEPIGGPNYFINNYTLTAGIIFNHQLKISTGFTYRFYHSFYHYILNTPDINWGSDPAFYRKDPHLKASNFIYFIGCEFLLGHIGLELNEGINLYKPFYKEYNIRWEFKKGFEYTRCRYISSRIGLNYYLIDTSRMPRNNLWVGAHIDANFGEADFMEVCLGYAYIFK